MKRIQIRPEIVYLPHKYINKYGRAVGDSSFGRRQELTRGGVAGRDRCYRYRGFFVSSDILVCIPTPRFRR